jgi:hypothetical protein
LIRVFLASASGLLSAHILAEYLHDRMHRMTWYQGELLNLALDVGYRLLPAFNSSTGFKVFFEMSPQVSKS